jgi:hypothetical protein
LPIRRLINLILAKQGFKYKFNKGDDCGK